MLFLLSPAKSLDFTSVLPPIASTSPLFVPRATELIATLKQKSPQDIAALMQLSDSLSGLNVARYQAWRPRSTARNSRPAVLAFNGDVYGGLDAGSLDAQELAWLQDHLCILSGLYGVLRPLDGMQPYRLEMGTPLENARGRNLYEFWGTEIAGYLRQRLRRDATPMVVNLASKEYFKAVDLKALKMPVVECVFEDFKDDRYRIISFHAKRARGLMMRFAVLQRATTPEQLQAFDLEGYAYAAGASEPRRLVFRRRMKN